MPKNICHSAMHPRFPFFPHHSPSHWGFWERLEFSPCLSFHVFGCWLHFSYRLEVVFVVPGIGLFSSRFGSRWCIFHSRFIASCVFTMAVKGHSRFGLSHRLFGAFFPAVCSLISFRNVCFPPCCESFLLLRLGTVVDGLKSFFPWFKL